MFFSKNRVIEFAILFFMISTAGLMGSEGDVSLDITQPGDIEKSHSTPIVLGEMSDAETSVSPHSEILSKEISEQRDESFRGLDCLPIIRVEKTDSNLKLIRQAQKIGILLAPVLEAGVDIMPVVLACLSNQSSEVASASFIQNVTYTSIYGGCLLKNVYDVFYRDQLHGAVLLTFMCLTNTVSGAAATFSSWQYRETSQQGYRIANIALNTVSGSVAFVSKIVARRNQLYKWWYGEEMPSFIRIYASS
ncbi:hypothetical protein [Candidatus Finniella inopinata]|uniref:Uncharacterized protein n=1 Tax=Candidatus Finniella inopinata TaxID=1696036 RepID=A0A4Q7DKV2_9PROT|nr:hypothetical protein [Candidatus Finniella inopinata]RZI46754.1 hypothetical protein EQU50_01840 [Candidatus Finniella inopinata]